MFSGLRNFIIVFIVSLLCFGVIGHFLSKDIIPNLIKGDISELVSEDDNSHGSTSENPNDDNSDDKKKENGESYSFAVICLDLEDKLSSVFFIHTNEGYETCVYTTIPGKIPLENNGADSTLERIYATTKDEGVDFFLEKLKYITGYKIDGYAMLNAIDVTGNGRSITDLSTYLNYTCKVTVPFSYPNPNYIDPSDSEAPSIDSSDDSGAAPEISDDISDDTSNVDTSNEFINIPAGDYALNGFMPLIGQAEQIRNYQVLLDSRYNVYAHEIYTGVLKRIFSAKTSSVDAKVFNYFSVVEMDKETAYKHLFNTFDKYEYKYPENAEGWNEAVAALRELEIGE